MNLKNGKVFTSKSVGTGPSSYEKKNLPVRGLTKVEEHCSTASLSVRMLTIFELLYKHNNDTEFDVSFLNTCAYTFSTFG